MNRGSPPQRFNALVGKAIPQVVPRTIGMDIHNLMVEFLSQSFGDKMRDFQVAALLACNMVGFPMRYLGSERFVLGMLQTQQKQQRICLVAGVYPFARTDGPLAVTLAPSVNHDSLTVQNLAYAHGHKFFRMLPLPNEVHGP